MARPKEFDRDQAVRRAMVVFWEKGYEATSTEDLLRAMGIGRQSMYDTFGDKHRLYLEALERYNTENTLGIMERLRAGTSPLSAIEEVLLSISRETHEQRLRGCMGVNATSELAQKDPEVASLIRSASTLCEAALARMVLEGKKKGEIDPSMDERSAGRFLLTTLQGMRVNAKAGATPESLRDVVSFTLAGLKAR